MSLFGWKVANVHNILSMQHDFFHPTLKHDYQNNQMDDL
jgi:hypothetical protein